MDWQLLQASLLSWCLHLSSQTHHLLMCENSKFFYCLLWIIYIKSTFSSIFCSFWHFPHFIHSTNMTSKSITWDFPGGPVSKTLHCQYKGWGFNPWSGKIPHAMWPPPKKSVYMNRELPDVQAGFRKGRETKDQTANIRWVIEKAREFQKKHLLLLHWLHQSLWLCGSQQTGKFWKWWE